MGRVGSNSMLKILKPVMAPGLVAHVHGLDEDKCLEVMKKNGLLAVGFGRSTIRLVTHLDFSDDQMEQLNRVLQETSKELS